MDFKGGFLKDMTYAEEEEYYNTTLPENTMQDFNLTITKVNGKVTSRKIDGVEIKDMKDNQIITDIQKAEKRIEELESVKALSKTIKSEIKRLNKFVVDVVNILDEE